jgi:hypothetical protein
MSTSEEQSTNNSENQKLSSDKNNNNLKLKFVALRNGLIEEKNKSRQLQSENENLQKEVEELKKQIAELTSKNKEFEEENQKIKEENVTKQESINKLKEELQKYRDKSNKKLTSFFSSLLESDNPENVEEKDKKDSQIESLEQENLRLNKELSEIKNKLEFNDKKLNESINDLNTFKEKSQKEMDEIENKYKKTIEEINNENNLKEKDLNQRIDEAEKKLVEYLKAIRDKDIIIKSIESIRGDRDKDVLTMKEKVRIAEETLNQNNEEMKIIKNQNELMNKDIINYNKKIEDLKVEIQQYKLIIEDLTPLSKDYTFKGKILNDNKNSNKNLEVSFGKYQQSVYMKIGEKELILISKEILDVLGNKYIQGQVKFILKLNESKNNTEIIGQFTKKEGEYIRKFFIEFKNKSSNKEEELMNMSLNNYYY